MRTRIHENTHALLYFGISDDTERSNATPKQRRSSNVVERFSGFDTSESAFYPATWESGDSEGVRDRLRCISRTPEELDVVKGYSSRHSNKEQ